MTNISISTRQHYSWCRPTENSSEIRLGQFFHPAHQLQAISTAHTFILKVQDSNLRSQRYIRHWTVGDRLAVHFLKLLYFTLKIIYLSMDFEGRDHLIFSAFDDNFLSKILFRFVPVWHLLKKVFYGEIYHRTIGNLNTSND